jgi:hypothetical protein
VVAFGGIATTAKPWSLFTLPMTIIVGVQSPGPGALENRIHDLTCGERESPKV